MKILALIIARGGSKRLPGKNIRLLGGKPLIVWSIDAAKNIPEICDILVSTDDQTIANICKNAGAFVPWLRPSELAKDETSSIDVVLHALNWYETEKNKVDGILLLQPTSPFRTTKTIKRGIEIFIKNKCKPVYGISPTKNHPMWMLKVEKGYLLPFMLKHGLEIRSQDLPQIFIVNGVFYLMTPKELRKCHSFLGGKTIPLIIDSPEEALDIDTILDFKIAEFILELRQ